MFKALTDMLKTPVTIKPFMEIDTNGDKSFGELIHTKCLVETRVDVVRTGRMSKTGDREVYEGVMYVSGDIPITQDDHIILGGVERPIEKLWADYEGANVSMWVVYF